MSPHFPEISLNFGVSYIQAPCAYPRSHVSQSQKLDGTGNNPLAPYLQCALPPATRTSTLGIRTTFGKFTQCLATRTIHTWPSRNSIFLPRNSISLPENSHYLLKNSHLL